MPRRPLSIIVFSLVYLVSPFAIVVQAAYVNALPLWGRSGVLNYLSVLDALALVAYLAIAAAIYSVRCWGWWLFLGLSLFLVAHNLLAFRYNVFNQVLPLFLYNLALMLSCAYFFRRQLIAPYFNPSLRWWEHERRYQLKLHATVELDGQAIDLHLIDLSLGGCCVHSDQALPERKEYPVTLRFNDDSVLLKSQLMRQFRLGEGGGHGYGLRFGHGDTVDEGLAAFIGRLRAAGFETGRDSGGRGEQRRHPRLEIGLQAFLLGAEGPERALLVDFSRRGCLLKCRSAIQAGALVRFRCLFKDRAYEDGLTVMWSRAEGDERLLGCRFRFEPGAGARQAARFLAALRQSGARWRNAVGPVSAERQRALIEQGLERSPYRLVLALRRLLARRGA